LLTSRVNEVYFRGCREEWRSGGLILSSWIERDHRRDRNGSANERRMIHHGCFSSGVHGGGSPLPSLPLPRLSLSLSPFDGTGRIFTAQSQLRWDPIGVRSIGSQALSTARRIPRVRVARVPRLAAELAENNGRFGCATRG